MGTLERSSNGRVGKAGSEQARVWVVGCWTTGVRGW